MGDEIMDLIKSMLKFNPNERLSIPELLEKPIFKEYRNTEMECLSDKEINLNIDAMPLNPDTGEYEDYTTRKMMEYIVKLYKHIKK